MTSETNDVIRPNLSYLPETYVNIDVKVIRIRVVNREQVDKTFVLAI